MSAEQQQRSGSASRAGADQSGSYAGVRAVQGVDPNRLCAWLQARSATPNQVAFAVYQGLIARIRRGDFDLVVEEEIRP